MPGKKLGEAVELSRDEIRRTIDSDTIAEIVTRGTTLKRMAR